MAALVIGLSTLNSQSAKHSPYRSDRVSAARTSRFVFHGRWAVAACIAWYESRATLAARNGSNLGPWQINVLAHPWANPWKLTHSWRYSAIAASRISRGGRDWSAWTTHSLCGV